MIETRLLLGAAAPANLLTPDDRIDVMVQLERHVGPGEDERFPNRALTVIPLDFGPDLFVHASFVQWFE